MSNSSATASDQAERVAIVTGANSGIGYETCAGLACEGFLVIMACRNIQKAEEARTALLRQMPEANLMVRQLDLTSLTSVRAFSQAFLEEFDRLDLLINNAGIMVPPFSLTEDGFESQLGANYLGHFLLTGLLLERLAATQHSRVVSLSSIAHRSGRIHFSDLHFENRYSAIKAYAQSKLACLMFAYELDRRLRRQGIDVKSVAAHPGVSNTNLSQHIPGWMQTLMSMVTVLITHSPKAGAQPTLMAALDSSLAGGDYIGPTGFQEMKGKAGKVEAKPHAYDEAVAKRLWDVSEELVNFSYLPRA
ncbi:MAG: SDR family NAD(P)-dependent oxidoreductase [Saccharospirillum sp.]|nr:SDR family NAD(P)-dependent oxidoreductase [Saccharospirillum sp.]